MKRRPEFLQTVAEIFLFHKTFLFTFLLVKMPSFWYSSQLNSGQGCLNISKHNDLVKSCNFYKFCLRLWNLSWLCYDQETEDELRIVKKRLYGLVEKSFFKLLKWLDIGWKGFNLVGLVKIVWLEWSDGLVWYVLESWNSCFKRFCLCIKCLKWSAMWMYGYIRTVWNILQRLVWNQR